MIAVSASPNARSHIPSRCRCGNIPAQMAVRPAPTRRHLLCASSPPSKATRSFAIYKKGNKSELAPIAGPSHRLTSFPFFFRGLPAVLCWHGIQLGVIRRGFAQIRSARPPYDLLTPINMIGLPLTFRAGPFGSRAASINQELPLCDDWCCCPTRLRAKSFVESGLGGCCRFRFSAVRVFTAGARRISLLSIQAVTRRSLVHAASSCSARERQPDRSPIGRLVAA